MTTLLIITIQHNICAQNVQNKEHTLTFYHKYPYTTLRKSQL